MTYEELLNSLQREQAKMSLCLKLAEIDPSSPLREPRLANAYRDDPTRLIPFDDETYKLLQRCLNRQKKLLSYYRKESLNSD